MKEKKNVNQVEMATPMYADDYYSSIQVADIFMVNDELQFNRDKFFKNLVVNGMELEFEIDSGAAITLMWVEAAKRQFPKLHLHRTSLRLVTIVRLPLA